MSDLDKKLYSIVEKDGKGQKMYPGFVYNRAEAIKQAFIDDGWHAPHKASDELKAELHTEALNQLELEQMKSGMMTGEEWYDRFTHQLKHVGIIDWSASTKKKVLAAAKKAAGME